MALSAWDKTRVYATWYTHAGTRIPGTYVVHMPVRVTVEDGDAIVPAGIYAQGDLVTASENVPALDVMVPANDDPDVTPLGWQIRIDVTLAPPGGAKITERYVIDTPVDGEVNLRTIPLAQTIPPTQTMLLRGVAGGVAALDAQGRVIDAEGNPVSGVSNQQLATAIGEFISENPDAINASWDNLDDKPEVIAAGTTQEQARQAIAAAPQTQAVPTGGTTGQVLAKSSNDNHAVTWIDPPAGGGGSFAVPIFDSEAEALAALSNGEVDEGDVVGIRQA